MSYRALRVYVEEEGSLRQGIEQLELSQLPEEDTLIRVQWSGLNYKDALSFSGNRGITRNYPHTPGIDAAGMIVQSPEYAPGSEVLVQGQDLGMNTPGGLGEFIRVPSEWVIPKPQGLSLRDAMALGTAGFTAAQCVRALERNGLNPEQGEVLVTGASGGVGSVAISLLAARGYHVVAASRAAEDAAWLKQLGAMEWIDSRQLLEDSGRPMLKSRWAAAVDTLAGKTLELLIRSMQPRGVIAFCGMITGTDLHSNVFPFILRGLSLIGVDSAGCPMDEKREIWNWLGAEGRPAALESLVTELRLDDVPQALAAMARGESHGRQVVRVSL